MDEYDLNNDSDSDDDDYDDNLYFDPDEVSGTRFNIVLCELYCVLHGVNNNKQMYYYYLNISSFKWFNCPAIYRICKTYNIYYNNLEINKSYSLIKNFNTIVSKNNYIKPEIAENIMLESGHCVCILKTFWLRLIQRTWKRIYLERCRVIKLRCCYASIKEREITGLWPEGCRVYPGLTSCLKLK
jgi:hypothetical protein